MIKKIFFIFGGRAAAQAFCWPEEKRARSLKRLIASYPAYFVLEDRSFMREGARQLRKRTRRSR